MLQKVLLLVFVCCAAAAIDNCKKGGEYCLNHRDCCSNTCLSYLYKCSRVQNAQAVGGVAQSSPAYFAPALIPIQTDTDSAPLDVLYQLVFRPVPKTGREINEIQLRFAEETHPAKEFTTINPTADGPAQCLEIGDKCYTKDDCCSKKCHGFLQQCVT